MPKTNKTIIIYFCILKSGLSHKTYNIVNWNGNEQEQLDFWGNSHLVEK